MIDSRMLFERYRAVAAGFEEGYEGRAWSTFRPSPRRWAALSGDLTDFIADVQKRLGG